MTHRLLIPPVLAAAIVGEVVAFADFRRRLTGENV